MNFIQEAKKISEELIHIRREFHENPELDFDLHKTSDRIKDFLRNEYIEFYSCAGTGVVATIYGEGDNNNGKTIAIRCDMDALPLEEKNSHCYTSKIIGKMHACGHDAHMTMVLGSAKILNNNRKELKGNVKFIFEPAEETTGGARIMIEEGALETPHVDAIIGCHVDESLDVGAIGLKQGVAYAASNPFSITIYGKGAHGASPHKGIDPIVIASQVISALQLLVSRETSPVSPGVITIGTINGGTAANIIPDKVTITGIIRTMNLEDREYMKNRLKEVVTMQVESLRGTCEITIDESYPCLYNDDNMYNIFYDNSVSLLGKDKVKILREPTMGVESFAYFSLKVPAMFYQLGCGNLEKGIIYPLHSSKFDIDEECLQVGVAVHCNMAVNYLNKL
ncbi:M20 family metallopeptidase [uncultured Clostridium sp.]|uniref:M20 metallopeptidase family protein n=1 Tax=uncultured Clostridium sp. TaxID=59620 RepID=UPI0032167A32